MSLKKMSHQKDEAWKIGHEFELLCKLDFRSVIMDIEKKIVKIMTHKNQNIPTEINRIVSGSELKFEKSAVFTNFVAHSEREPNGEQII